MCNQLTTPINLYHTLLINTGNENSIITKQNTYNTISHISQLPKSDRIYLNIILTNNVHISTDHYITKEVYLLVSNTVVQNICLPNVFIERLPNVIFDPVYVMWL